MDEKFGMGSMGFGPLPGITETMEFVKRAWSTFSLPSNMTPTLDVEELDKRIADLRTVEQWLSLNLGMLQSAIQGLEIQRGTLVALKAFGDAVGTPGGLEAGAAAAKAMAAMAAAPAAPTSAASSAATTQARVDAAPAAAPATDAGDEPARGANAAQGSAGAFSQASHAAVNPAAWWNLLQSQFAQVAEAAMAGAASGAAAPPSGDPAGAARTRKPAARKRAAGKAATRPPEPRPRKRTG